MDHTGKPNGCAEVVLDMSCLSPDNAPRFNSSPNKPPKIPTDQTLPRRRPLTRSVSKRKTRCGGLSVPIDLSTIEEIGLAILQENTEVVSSRKSSPSPGRFSHTAFNTGSLPAMPKIPFAATPEEEVFEDEDEQIFKKVSCQREKKCKKVKTKISFEWVVFCCLSGLLIANLSVHSARHYMICGLEAWKWSLLALVTFSGMFITKWLIRFLVFLVERNSLLRKKVLYFVHGLKKSVQVFLWLGFVLLAWMLFFNWGLKRSPQKTLILDYLTWTIITLLIGSFLWMLKTLFLKILKSNFHVNRFFDRIQEAIFDQYILQTLSGPPIMDCDMLIGLTNCNDHMRFQIEKKGKEGKELIDVEKLYRMKRDKVSAWTMKGLVDFVSSSGLSTISSSIDEFFYEGQADKVITNEMEAIAAAYYIFKNVAHTDRTFICEDDLRRFMIQEEVDVVFPLFEGSETGRIDKKALTNWVVKAYKGRKVLAHALTDTKTAVKQLNKLATAILVVIIIVVWLILMEIATTKVLVFLSSQLVAAGFIFKSACETVFEAIMFVFVVHPFDVGDRCVVDGVQMVVEEMNILTTVFLRSDNEMIYYPNAVLSTKPISNFYRSPDMGDSIEFSIDFRTPVEKIGALKEKIKHYLEKNSRHWNPNHCVLVNEIENVNKINMGLYFSHTMNFQEYGEKCRRRSELVLEMKKFFEQLGIGYSLLPQEVHLAK